MVGFMGIGLGIFRGVGDVLSFSFFLERLVSDHESVEMMEWMSFDLRALFTVECLAGANDAVNESKKTGV